MVDGNRQPQPRLLKQVFFQGVGIRTFRTTVCPSFLFLLLSQVTKPDPTFPSSVKKSHALISQQGKEDAGRH